MLKRLVKSWTGSVTATPGGTPITKDNLFDTIPADCDQECHSCTIKYPANFKVEEGRDLWQTGKEWATHIIIATGKSDWVRDVSDEKGSLMEAISEAKKPTNGKLRVSASNMCPPPEHYTEDAKPTMCIILPSWIQIERISTDDVPELIEKFINPGPTTTTPMPDAAEKTEVEQTELAEGVARELGGEEEEGEAEHKDGANIATSSLQGIPPPGEGYRQEVPNTEPSDTNVGSRDPKTVPQLTDKLSDLSLQPAHSQTAAQLAASSYLKSHECPHDYLILLCSHKHRDARCGKSAPLIHRELRRHLQPLGLYRDIDDFRPGGVGIFFVNHVGGHKWSANMIIYRKKAGQGIWLARVRPTDVEAIVKWTVLEGKVQPDKIRAGFDRSRGVASW
ncbi:hypothetical protein DRE_06004 [Drechslerella stenobrocha 248]|uniref:Actin patches distal protein 1 n=1 Tax=Drechslerella stenobrocha 248 TaxID=1043628 RepID=W7HYL7_9PEZI|nr:hypothetical protein DRE_06004 [Drechslerella stenobrocha 248]